ncbi:UPF0496 protein 4-like [Lotus japonicus]|uniref:UPF0496 protein 4-like n=1 Tax=Lotus japonicus TaxID=34305 RepID=UPI00258A8E8A|nr:UPF0496 protein 4-like [Lotus japonicus]
MVLLVEKLSKLYFKLENRHHHHHHHPQTDELLSSSLHAFQSHVSRFIGQLALDLKPGTDQTLSLTWFQRCFRLFPIINKAFAKLVVDIDYPMSRWENDSIEGYLSYTLSLLQLLNSISSSISHLGQSKLSLAHGLSLLEKSPSLARKHLSAYLNSCSGLPESILLSQKQLGGVAFPRINSPTNVRVYRVSKHPVKAGDDDKARILSGKERIVHEGIKEMKSVGFWVCGVVLSCLYGDARPYMELRKIAGGFESSSVATLDFKISEQLMEKMPMFGEIQELNSFVAEVAASDEVKRHEETTELQTKLHEFEKLLDGMSKEVDNLFADVMTQRSELINVFRF